MKSGSLLFGMTTLAVLAVLVFGNAVIPVNAAGANDDFDSATVISSVPFTVVNEDISTATSATDDPYFACDISNKGAKTVWYSFTPSLDGTLYVNTFNSDYDTLLAVWSGTRGSLTNEECNDDYAGTLSALRVALTAGTTYYIEVASKDGSGGNLNLYVNFGATCGDPDNQDNRPLFTTRDNEDNTGTGVGDCDLDIYTFRRDAFAPIEFTINVPYATGIEWAQLFLLGWDVEDEAGEVDDVYFNGHYVDPLTGASGAWSTTILPIDPAWIVQGDNLVTIDVDVTNTDPANGWATSVDWGQLVLNGQTDGTASIRSVTTDKSTYFSGDPLNVTVEVDTPLPTKELRIEVNLRNSSGGIVAGTANNHTITGSNDDPITIPLTIPASTANGSYEVQVIVYDRLPNLYQDSATTPVTIYATHTATFRSTGSQDGWILESSETSNAGGSLNSTATTFNLGDGTSDRQYRAILSFNTASLPDTAVITKVTLKIKKQGQTGSNPFTLLGALRVAIRQPFFGASAGMANNDFQAAASLNNIGNIPNAPVSNWYSKTWTSGTFFSFINLTGITQFRLYFAKDDNDDNGADYMSFYSGNHTNASVRPTLIIEYYVP